MVKKIDNRQKHLAHRVSGRPYSAGVSTLRKRKKVSVVTGLKRKSNSG